MVRTRAGICPVVKRAKLVKLSTVINWFLSMVYAGAVVSMGTVHTFQMREREMKSLV
jgi:hypothetical protein